MRRLGFVVLSCLVSAACGPAPESDAHGPADAVAQSQGKLQFDVVLSASSLDFGPQTVGTTSAPLILTVRNNGTEAVHFGPLAAYPPFSPNHFDGSELAPGSSREIQLVFRPTSAGTFSTPLYFAPSGPSGSAFFTVTLLGTGVAP